MSAAPWVGWRAGPRPGELHVLRLRLDLGERTRSLAASLSEDERAHASRFRHDRLRWRYVCGRAQLRLVLGDLVGRPAADVPLDVAPLGKPRLACPSPIRFNLAHSGDVGLLAFASDAEVGVDLEPPAAANAALLEATLTATECAHVLAAPAWLRAHAFARLWVRKEALLKAAGCGLSLPPNELAVPVAGLAGPVAVPAARSLDGATRLPPLWLLDLPDVDGCVASVACERRPVAVHHWWLDGL